MATIIEKLSLSLKDFKNCLKHKHNETGVEELILRLRIQDDNKFKKRSNSFSMTSKANIVEQVV